RSLERLSSQVARAIEGVSLVEQRAAGRSEARFRSLVQNSSDLIAVLDRNSTFAYLAPSVRSVLGFEAEELIGAQFAELLHSEERTAIEAALSAAARSNGNCTLEFRMRRRDDTWCALEAVISNLFEDPSVRGLVVTGHDVTQRRELEEQLSHQAFHDSLTSLANRALFLDRVSNALERSRRTFLRVAVLFIDIDDFKTVNDSLGHAAGDELLVGVAGCLREAVRDADAVARLGGGEVAALLEGRDPGPGEAVAGRARGAAARESRPADGGREHGDLPAREHRHRARWRRRERREPSARGRCRNVRREERGEGSLLDLPPRAPCGRQRGPGAEGRPDPGDHERRARGPLPADRTARERRDCG